MRIIIEYDDDTAASVYDDVICNALWQREDIENTIKTMCLNVPSDKDELEKIVSKVCNFIRVRCTQFPTAEDISSLAQIMIKEGENDDKERSSSSIYNRS